MIRWAVNQQVELGLETITDGEGYREKDDATSTSSAGGRFHGEHGLAVLRARPGFAIECARVTGEIRNPQFQLVHNWKVARAAAPASVAVKQTVTGPHVLTRFSVNQRPDLYPDEQSLCRAYAEVLRQELVELVEAGCEHIQFDEPMWTEAPEQSEWAVDILNELIDSLGPGAVRVARLRRNSAPEARVFHEIHGPGARLSQGPHP